MNVDALFAKLGGAEGISSAHIALADSSQQQLSDEWRRKTGLMTMNEIVAALDPGTLGLDDDFFANDRMRSTAPALPVAAEARSDSKTNSNSAAALSSPPPRTLSTWAAVTHSDLDGSASYVHTAPSPPPPTRRAALDGDRSLLFGAASSASSSFSNKSAKLLSAASVDASLVEHLRAVSTAAATASATAVASSSASFTRRANHAPSDAAATSYAPLNAPVASVAIAPPNQQPAPTSAPTAAATAASAAALLGHDERLLAAMPPLSPASDRTYSYRAARAVGTLSWLSTTDCDVADAVALAAAPPASATEAVYDLDLARRLAGWRTGGAANTGAYAGVTRARRFDDTRPGSKVRRV